MGLLVRAFEERDLDAVVALSLRAWEPVFTSMERVLGPSGIYARMYPDWRAAQRRAVADTCRADGTRVWVAECPDPAGSVARFVAGFVAARLDHDESTGEIHMIAVDPAHQRSGVGSRLLAETTRWFRDSGMAQAMVETGGDPGHGPARAMYERAGFTPMPVVRYFLNL